jgi:hypothetical protein
VRPLIVVVVTAMAVVAVRARAASPSAAEAPQPIPSTVVYRASKVASFESLGVTMVACRHADSQPRTIALDFRDPADKKVSVFGFSARPAIARGQKVLFVTDSMHFKHREVVDVRLGHLPRGTLRVFSDARRIKCMGRIRFDPGPGAPTKWRGIGLVREGIVVSPGPDPW